MNVLKTFIPAAALAAGLTFSAAANAAIYIGLSTDGGATITTVASSAGNNAFVGGLSFGSFTINNISGTVASLPDLLDSNSLNTSSAAAGTLDIYVLATDFAASSAANGFTSSLTSNTLPNGWTVTEMAWVDAANSTTYAAGVNIASHMFSAIGTSVINAGAAVGPGPYAITEQYHIVATGAGNANSTIDVTGVPEPATWGLMIVGFGGVGAMVRNRRRQVVALTA
jgi:hypothetical protein